LKSRGTPLVPAGSERHGVAGRVKSAASSRRERKFFSALRKNRPHLLTRPSTVTRLALTPFCPLLRCQLLLERDDFLQAVGVMLGLKFQLAFEIGVAGFEPGDILLADFQFQ
jgi:hypothetical protein